jgi:hypothetical protein
MRLDMNTTKGKVTKAILPYTGNFLPYADKKDVSFAINDMVQYGILTFEVVKKDDGSNVVIYKIAANWQQHAQKLCLEGVSKPGSDLKSVSDALLSMVKKGEKPQQ